MSDLEKQTGAHHTIPQNGGGVSDSPNFPRAHGAMNSNYSPNFPGASNFGPDGKSLHLRQIANPAPLGLMSFATTTLVLSFINVEARHVMEPNVVVGLALGTGGLVQLLAGMWEFVCGNTFGATAFSSYGAFWLSYAVILIPGSGILDAYSASASELDNALGFFLMGWFIVTFIFFLASLRSTAVLIALFGFLDLTFLLLMSSYFVVADNPMNAKLKKAGGAFGILTAAIAYYGAASGLVTNQASFFALPVGDMPKYKES